MVSIIVVKKNFDENVPEVVSAPCFTIKQLEDNSSSTLRFQCTNDEWINIASSLSNNSNIETIYYLAHAENLFFPAEIDDENSKWVRVDNERTLIRNLYFKKMLYYVKKGLDYKREDDFYQSNLCFDKAQETRKQIQLTC